MRKTKTRKIVAFTTDHWTYMLYMYIIYCVCMYVCIKVLCARKSEGARNVRRIGMKTSFIYLLLWSQPKYMHICIYKTIYGILQNIKKYFFFAKRRGKKQADINFAFLSSNWRAGPRLRNVFFFFVINRLERMLCNFGSYTYAVLYTHT